MPDGIMVAAACLPACRAALSPGQKPAIIHCPLRRTVVASRVYWWFPSGVMGLASARHRSVDSRRRRSGRLLMDIVGCLPLRWCIIVDDLAQPNASARYLAPSRPPCVLITARFYCGFKESIISKTLMLSFEGFGHYEKNSKDSIRTRTRRVRKPLNPFEKVTRRFLQFLDKYSYFSLFQSASLSIFTYNVSANVH